MAAVIGALLTFFGLTILKVKSNFTTKRKLTSLIENPELNIEADTFKDLESKNIFWVFTTATVLISMILLFFLPINISEYQKENFIAIDKVRGKNTTIKKPNVYWHKLKWFGGVTLNFKAKDNKTYEIGTLTTDWMTASLESKQIKVECSVDSSNPLEVKTYTLNLYDLIVNNKKIDNCFGFNIREYLAYKKQDYLPSEKERLDALKLKFKLDETNLSSLRIGRYNVLNSDEIKVEADKLKALIIKGKNRENYVPLFKIKNNKIEEFSEILNKIYNETLIRKDTLLKVFKTYKTEISNRGGLVDNTNKRIIERCILITSILKATQFNLENKNYEKQYFDKSDLDIISEGFKSFYPNTVNGYEGEVAQSILGMLLSIGKYHPETRGYINRCIINKYLNEKLPPKDKPREKANYYNKRLSYILETHTHGLLNDANVGKSEAFITLVKNYIKYHGGYLNSKDTEGFIKLLENKLKQKGHVLKDDLSKYLEDIIINANS